MQKNTPRLRVSVVTEFEIYCGSTDQQKVFWDQLFQNVTIIPFDSMVNVAAVGIFKDLKSKGNLIEIPDLFIGAIALVYNMKLATLNEKHFNRIERLELIGK